jgi:hypothetical protein
VPHAARLGPPAPREPPGGVSCEARGEPAAAGATAGQTSSHAVKERHIVQEFAYDRNTRRAASDGRDRTDLTACVRGRIWAPRIAALEPIRAQLNNLRLRSMVCFGRKRFIDRRTGAHDPLGVRPDRYNEVLTAPAPEVSP